LDFKINDWCYCNFKLQLITKLSDDGNVVETTDGYNRYQGNNIKYSIFPLDMKIKLISETYEIEYKRLQNLKCDDQYKQRIYIFFIKNWAEACELKDNVDELQLNYKNLMNVVDEILSDAGMMINYVIN